MELTGKCKEEFEKWFTKDIEDFENYDQHLLNEFYKQIYSMKYGVLVDYFDSMGVIIEVLPICELKISGLRIMGYRFYVNGDIKGNVILNSRPEARTTAIKKADELRNEELNK